MKKVQVKLEVEMRPEQLIDAAMEFTKADIFDYKVWSVWQARRLQHLARLILKGYKVENQQCTQ